MLLKREKKMKKKKINKKCDIFILNACKVSLSNLVYWFEKKRKIYGIKRQIYTLYFRERDREREKKNCFNRLKKNEKYLINLVLFVLLIKS